MSAQMPQTPDASDYPTLNFQHMDTLWLQVTGTLCNLACLHCFISCGPKNDSHPMMTLEQVLDALAWARARGVRDYYFTGGEPFMHPQIKAMIEATLQQGPLSILTNGVLIDDAMAAWLGQAARRARYSLDLRVSLDGTTAQENDAIRGRGTFEQILRGVDRLVAHGVNPVLTVTTCHAELAADSGRERFLALLRARGVRQPRIKLLSPFKIGREQRRHEGPGGYMPSERLYLEDVPDADADHLQCANSRMITAKGVYPCPILIEEDGARMGAHLDEAVRPIKLNHAACYTCHVQGVSCRT